MADLGGQLVEVTPLNGPKPVGDAMQGCVGRSVVPDARGRALGVAKIPFERRLMQSTA